MQRIECPHGAIVVVAGFEEHELVGSEQELAAALAPLRRREFVLGRTALRAALGRSDVVIGKDDRGAPVLPAGWVGSISHKLDRAAAIAAVDAGARIGVDIERAEPPRQPIERRVLTANEPVADARDVTLYFAIKEAIYKAIDPFVRRYVGFQEVEVDLTTREVRSQLPLAIEVWWCEDDGHYIASARATRRP